MTMRNILLAGLAALLAGTALLAAWPRLGTADLGAADFATLQRRDTPNDALACTPEFCAARGDIAAPVFRPPAGGGLPRRRGRSGGEPRLERVAAEEGQGMLRYVQRSRILGFPDTIDVKVVPVPEGGAAVLLYSRSKLGRSDMGVNRARIERWIGLIEASAQK